MACSQQCINSGVVWRLSNCSTYTVFIICLWMIWYRIRSFFSSLWSIDNFINCIGGIWKYCLDNLNPCNLSYTDTHLNSSKVTSRFTYLFSTGARPTNEFIDLQVCKHILVSLLNWIYNDFSAHMCILIGLDYLLIGSQMSIPLVTKYHIMTDFLSINT